MVDKKWFHSIPLVGGIIEGTQHKNELNARFAASRAQHAERIAEIKTNAVTKALEDSESKFAKQIAKEAERDALKAARFKPGLGFRIGQRGLGGNMKAAGKVAGIGALAVAGVTALGIAASNMRKNRSKLPPPDNSDLDALAASPLMGMEAGPADGRAPNEWQQRVRPGQQQERGPVNPSMNVSSDVQDLNSPGRA